MKRIILTGIIISTLFQAFAQTEIELDTLRFSKNWFNDLEDAKKNPDKVLYLDLSLQKIREFPEDILSFKNLKRLYLPYNYWSSIPDEISALSKLEVLDLSGNYYLNHLPDGLGNLKNLKKLIIKDHRLANGEIEKAKNLLPNCHFILD